MDGRKSESELLLCLTAGIVADEVEFRQIEKSFGILVYVYIIIQL